METDLESLLDRLKQRIDGGGDRIEAPFLYLDPGSVLHLYQEITGLGEPPRVVISPASSSGRHVDLTFEQGQGTSLPVQTLFTGLLPFIRQKVPLVEQYHDLTSLSHRLARFQGLLQSTRFPDGNLNLEIEFAGIRGILFYTKEYFSSMIQPLLDHDRFHHLACRVDVFAYVHGPVQKNIFYHQVYGDNMEYDWAPIVPMVLIEASENPGGAAE